MATKGELVVAAYKELRISGITVKPDGGEITDAIQRMDALISSWERYNLCPTYNKSESFSKVLPSQESGLPDSENLAIQLNLAVQLCPMYGKPVHPQTLSGAKLAYDNIFSVEPAQREQTPYLPKGSGDAYGSYFHDRFRFQAYEKNAPLGAEQIKVGQTKIFTFDLSSYGTIESYEITDGEGLKVNSDTETDGIFTLTCEGVIEGFMPIKITLTLDTGEINPVTINFNVEAS